MRWRLYDELIAGIPAGKPVDERVMGSSWVAVSSGGSVGVCMRQDGETRPTHSGNAHSSASLREMAHLARSWNMHEACFGIAAMNAWYNDPARLGGPDDGLPQDPFVRYEDRLVGKKVAFIGHFAVTERLSALGCDLVVIERNPRKEDFPDPAAEYLLPGRDFVFITGSALANKTLPRLLELCMGAFVVLVGPSVPLAPALFAYGISALSGQVFPDADSCLSIVCGARHHRLVRAGIKIHLEAPITLPLCGENAEKCISL